MIHRTDKTVGKGTAALPPGSFHKGYGEVEGRVEREHTAKTASEPLIQSGQYYKAILMGHDLLKRWTNDVTVAAVRGALAELRIVPGRITATSEIARLELDGEVKFVTSAELDATTPTHVEALHALATCGEFVGKIFPTIGDVPGRKIRIAAQARLEMLERNP